MTIRPNFVAYDRLGLWDTETNEWTFSYYEISYVDQSDLVVSDDIPQFWDTFANGMACNESFWYVQ